MAGSLMAVIDNNKNNVVASGAGENDGNGELGLLTKFPRRIHFTRSERSNSQPLNQSTKQFNF